MSIRDNLTTAHLKSLGINPFEFANSAIQVMRSYIRKGHQISVDELLELLRKKGVEEVLREAQYVEAFENSNDA